jgi:site-specific recombinase XerD
VRRPEELELPLAELWQRWWDATGQSLSRSSQKTARRVEHVSRALPSSPTPGHVALWLGELARHLAPGTVALYRDRLHSVYAVAQRAGWASWNPVALCPWRRPPAASPRPLRELPALWPTLLATMPDVRARAFLGVLRYCGLRPEEALGLIASDVVTSGEPWRLMVVRQRPHPNMLHTTPPKGRGPRGRRFIPIRPPLRELLRPVLELRPAVWRRIRPARVETVPFLFPYRDPQIAALRARLALVDPVAFGPRRAWMVFRHTLALELLRAGKSRELVGAVLGHARIETTERYCARLVGAEVPANAFDGLD